MTSWKRRIAKEWLIFLCTMVLVGSVSYGGFYVKYRIDKKQYEKELTKWVKGYWADWKPEEVAPLSELQRYRQKYPQYDNLSDDEFDLHLRSEKRSVFYDMPTKAEIETIRTFKKLFPKYSSWSKKSLWSRRPAMSVSAYLDFPEKPVDKFFRLAALVFSAIVAGSGYLLLLFTRSVAWSVRQVRRKDERA